MIHCPNCKEESKTETQEVIIYLFGLCADCRQSIRAMQAFREAQANNRKRSSVLLELNDG